MDRRAINRTEESVYSITESMKDLAIAGLQYAKDYVFTDQELAISTPEHILSRMLSTKSYISTTSSLGERNNAAIQDPSLQRFEQIGKGQCGTVYALTGTDRVAKLSNSNEKNSQLECDWKMHSFILESIRACDPALTKDINVPQIYIVAGPETYDFWNEEGLRFPQHIDTQTFAIISTRIFPIPLPVREAIVDSLCPYHIRRNKQEFLGRSENKNCLIRIYLGRRALNMDRQNTVGKFKLENFPLHVNEMEKLGLDTIAYAQVMARTLAILHWKASVDGNDVEFILGSSPQLRGAAREEAELDIWAIARRHRFNFHHRAIKIWLIDFNQCSTFEDDSAGLKKIIDAFFWNDPYYPDPASDIDEDKKLWLAFKTEYVEVSRLFTQSTTPERFIEEIEGKCRKTSVGGLF